MWYSLSEGFKILGKGSEWLPTPRIGLHMPGAGSDIIKVLNPRASPGSILQVCPSPLSNPSLCLGNALKPLYISCVLTFYPHHSTKPEFWIIGNAHIHTSTTEGVECTRGMQWGIGVLVLTAGGSEDKDLVKPPSAGQIQIFPNNQRASRWILIPLHGQNASSNQMMTVVWESTFSSIHSFTLPKYKAEPTTGQFLGIKFYAFEDYLNFLPMFHCFSNLSFKMPLKCQSVSHSVVSLRLKEL